MVDEESIRLYARYVDGDEFAAEEIFNRYVQRLTALARSRLSPKLARKVDAEDVVQSAYRSFFRAAQGGKFELSQSGKLWSLLAKITLFKVFRQVERFTTEKANIDREESPQLDGLPVAHVAREPTPDEVSALTEELQRVMGDLTDVQRQMLELHLQGHSVQEVAVKIHRSTKTVRRLLSKLENDLQSRLQGAAEEI